ncbi:uncharacterized protein [Chironomus tepperi]|uniref:uncharacterized protein n=1 Tax=Chironomus tepperi TaxID=113505 RepID=UPI00391FA874
MYCHESVQFLNHRDKKIIIEYKIESSNFDRFKNSFKTDKYISLVQWEYIMSKFKRAINGVMKTRDDWKNKKNRFTLDDLIISYEFVDKAEGLVNYEKISYEFDWIVKVKIIKSSTIRDSCSVQESQNSTSSPKKRSSSSSKESNAQNDENLIVDDHDEHIHESKKAKIDENDDLKSSVLQQSNRYNFKNRVEKSEPSRQSSITNWVTNKKEKLKSQRSKEPIPSTSKDALAQINKEKLQQMQDFVARSEQEEQKMLHRKEELKDYAILNCYDMRDYEIKETIKKLKFEINNLFENDTTELETKNNTKIHPCDITASNILTEAQSMLVLRTIEKLHAKDGKELCDNILHNVALPRVIIELFKSHHNLRTDEAVERIKTQEEKKILFKEEFNESY